MKKINKVLAVSTVILTLVTNVPVKQISAQEDNFSQSDRQSRDIYEPITKQLKLQSKSYSANTPDTLEVNDKTLSMTADDVIEVKAEFDYEVDLANLKWYLGDKEISQWKTWGGNDYNKDSFITATDLNVEVVNDDSTAKSIVTAKINVGKLYNSTNASSYRRQFPSMIGNYDLKLEDISTNTSFKSSIKLNVYDSYRTFDEIKPELDEIFKNANNNLYLDYQSIGKSVENRDLHFVVLAKDKDSVDNYLNKIVPMMLEEPEKLQNMVKDGSIGDYKVPIFLNNIHPDETPGVDAQIEILKKLTTEDTITFKSQESEDKVVDIDLNVSDLLDNVIFVMSLTENPDGRYYNVRQNANGFDLNRDNGYQTQPETVSIIEQIVKWNPISFLDLHGFVSGFLIEPCTPPHDQNYEYDLIAENATAQAKAMGNAGIGSTKYTKYEIPLLDYGVNGGWDDATPAYTGTYALHHGAMSHTIEVPELNQDSTDAFVGAILGASNFVLKDKNNLFIQQLEYYKRGVNGEDNKEIDKYLVNGKGEIKGRDREGNENFFPEYYVLPIDDKLQKNASAIYDTVDYLIRNGVEVTVLQSDTKVGEILYPKGSYVVDMHQAKRGYANTVLYKGSDESDFSNMYAEIVMNFPELRGFDKYEIRKEGVFDGKLKEISSAQKTGTSVNTNYNKYVIKNTNNDVIKAVNELLSNNKIVHVVAQDTGIFEEGEYIVNAIDLKSISSKYTLHIEPLKTSVKANKLEEPKVYAGGTYSKFVLKELGFNLVSNKSESNILVDDSSSVSPSDLKDGVDYLGIGRNAIVNVGEKVIDGLKAKRNNAYNEGLLKAEYYDDVVTGGYDDEEYIYTAGGTWIDTVPENVKVVAKVSDSDDFYVSGWWPGNDSVKGKVMGVTTDLAGEKEGTAVTLFANTITNKAHPQVAYRLIANTIYNSIDSDITTISGSSNSSGGGTIVVPDVSTKLTDVENHWAKNTIQSYVSKKYINGYPDNTFKPDKTITRAEFVKIVNKVFGYTQKTTIDFKDMNNNSQWYYDEVAISVKAGYIKGYEDKTFRPNDTISREEAALILSSILDLQGGKITQYKDNDTISSWAKDALLLLSSNNIMTGYKDNTIRPQGKMTRAEAVTVLERSENTKEN